MFCTAEWAHWKGRKTCYRAKYVIRDVIDHCIYYYCCRCCYYYYFVELIEKRNYHNENTPHAVGKFSTIIHYFIIILLCIDYIILYYSIYACILSTLIYYYIATIGIVSIGIFRTLINPHFLYTGWFTKHTLIFFLQYL